MSQTKKDLVIGSDKEKILHLKQLTFISKVLAEYTHGTRNNLAIIRESAGWLGDLLGGAGQRTKEDHEQFANVLSIIDRQVKILDRTSMHLSRFAQRVGVAFCTFDPGEILEEAVSFFTRFVRQREVSLKSEVAETLPSLYSDPVQIHLLIFVLINDMLERVGRGGKIVLHAGSAKHEVLIEVEGHGTLEAAAIPSEKGNQFWSTGQQIVADLGGRLQTTTVGSDMKQTSLFLPIKQTSNASKL